VHPDDVLVRDLAGEQQLVLEALSAAGSPEPLRRSVRITLSATATLSSESQADTPRHAADAEDLDDVVAG
jgi:hypothetical protein